MKDGIIYAPNVHSGGGLVLLKALIENWTEASPTIAVLDARARAYLNVPDNWRVYWCKPQLLSRMVAQNQVARLATSETRSLFFHGMPPVRRIKGKVIVFQQNRNYLGLNALSEYPFRTALRLALERFISFRFRHRVDHYIVQTNAMRDALQLWYGRTTKGLNIIILPFYEPIILQSSPKKWDFVYVADGVAHKNHVHLIEAWKILAVQGLFPTLVLTLGPRDKVLWNRLSKVITAYTLKIENLGAMTRDEIAQLYGASKALIFPSESESFGLPLIEAKQAGIAVLASELDFVRDVCIPDETFDPHSPVSIARAVKRFLGIKEHPVPLLTAAEFCRQLDQI